MGGTELGRGAAARRRGPRPRGRPGRAAGSECPLREVAVGRGVRDGGRARRGRTGRRGPARCRWAWSSSPWAVAAPKGIRDSKLLHRGAAGGPRTPDHPLVHGLVGGARSAEECDRLGMTAALRLAARRALDDLVPVAPDRGHGRVVRLRQRPVDAGPAEAPAAPGHRPSRSHVVRRRRCGRGQGRRHLRVHRRRLHRGQGHQGPDHALDCRRASPPSTSIATRGTRRRCTGPRWPDSA